MRLTYAYVSMSSAQQPTRTEPSTILQPYRKQLVLLGLFIFVLWLPFLIGFRNVSENVRDNIEEQLETYIETGTNQPWVYRYPVASGESKTDIQLLTVQIKPDLLKTLTRGCSDVRSCNSPNFFKRWYRIDATYQRNGVTFEKKFYAIRKPNIYVEIVEYD